jgi:hypothetical protein
MNLCRDHDDAPAGYTVYRFVDAARAVMALDPRAARGRSRCTGDHA